MKSRQRFKEHVTGYMTVNGVLFRIYRRKSQAKRPRGKYIYRIEQARTSITEETCQTLG
jgi:hypothetical protein